MKKIRAICITDVIFEECPVFELKDNGYFEMIKDNSFRYEKECIEEDPDWLIFEVEDEEVILTRQ